MPNRIVRERILTSDKVNALDAPAEVFFRRLMSVVDDFGRYDGRPSVVRAACFPLRLDKVREADISRWTAACQKAGLIVLYEVENKPYLELLNLCDRRRAKHSKYPDPACGHTQTSADTCAQMRPDSDSDSDSDAHPKNGGGVADSPEGFADLVPDSLRTPEFLRAWGEWIQYRLERKPRVTKTSAAKAFSMFEKVGPARAVHLIDRGISNGYQGAIFKSDFMESTSSHGETPEQYAARNASTKES